jgi:hypothetical protein
MRRRLPRILLNAATAVSLALSASGSRSAAQSPPSSPATTRTATTAPARSLIPHLVSTLLRPYGPKQVVRVEFLNTGARRYGDERPFDVAAREREVAQLAAAVDAAPDRGALRVLVVELVTRAGDRGPALYAREVVSWRTGTDPPDPGGLVPAPTRPGPVAGTTHLAGPGRADAVDALPRVFARGGSAFDKEYVFEREAEAVVLTYFDGAAWRSDSWFWLRRAIEHFDRKAWPADARDLYAVLREVCRVAERTSSITEHYGESLDD